MAVRDVVQAAAGVGGGSEYVEDVFSTYLYTGNSSTQTITNGIDLAGEGGLVWTKARGVNAESALIDTERGQGNYIPSNATSDSAYYSDLVTGFTSTGYTLGADVSRYIVNKNAYTYVSWTFRKAPKFFDVVTWTGTGGARTISHNLGSTPGCIIVKWYNVSGENWTVYHRGLNGGTNPQDYGIYLNLPNAAINEAGFWNDTEPTSTQFTVGGNLNSSFGGGGQYVAYLFAHDAGGFGDDGEQNVISCGSYTGNGSTVANPVTLGWEPQWVLIKQTNASGNNWVLFDVMRGIATGSDDQYLYPNTSGAEGSVDRLSVTSTGFSLNSLGGDTNANGSTYIYIAIRRGPMKTPESGTEVFNAVANTGTSTAKTIAGVGFAPDWVIAAEKPRTLSPYNNGWDRLRGANKSLITNETGGEISTTDTLVGFDVMDGFRVGADTAQGWINFSNGGFPNRQYINWCFKRAPGFMDVVAYTGTGVAHTEAHNLGVAPELMIVKTRSTAENWIVYHSALTATSYLNLNTNGIGGTTFIAWDNTEPTATDFTVGLWNNVNGSGVTNIAYLFATLDGVSKVSSYTGTGANLNVDCGFSAGARFILIKRTDSTGDWYVWDSARGIVSGNDPYLLLNSAAAENTSTDYIDPLASGFTVTSSAPAALNASGGSYIFLAIS